MITSSHFAHRGDLITETVSNYRDGRLEVVWESGWRKVCGVGSSILQATANACLTWDFWFNGGPCMWWEEA